MSFNQQALLHLLHGLEQHPLAQDPQRYVVLYSGGLDSTVLLHGLVALRDALQQPLMAVHVNHGLQTESDTWAAHCSDYCKELAVEFVALSVAVDDSSGAGPEAAARDARYAAMAEICERGDWLLSAHHMDDQVETLLINLMRGSGPAGVAGIPELRAFGDALLARPLLGVTRNALREYAETRNLVWIEDPSNAESRYDRNFLRNEVLPLMESRWPEARRSLARSAALARDATSLLADLADVDLRFAGEAVDRLSIDRLQRLTPARQSNLLRRAVDLSGLPPLPARQHEALLQQMLTADDDREPLIQWAGAEARRYRDQLYLLPASAALPFDGASLDPRHAAARGSRVGQI